MAEVTMIVKKKKKKKNEKHRVDNETFERELKHPSVIVHAIARRLSFNRTHRSGSIANNDQRHATLWRSVKDPLPEGE